LVVHSNLVGRPLCDKPFSTTASGLKI
jgi:hypothetical protein